MHKQWFSANMVISSFAIGLLGKQIWHMNFVDSVLTIIFFNLLGVMAVCYFSCFGPVFGLRQMVLSRFWFGWWGVKLSTQDKPHKQGMIRSRELTRKKSASSTSLPV